MIKLHLLALSCSLLALAWCIMAREPLHAALAADLERLGHDAAAVAAGTWPTRKNAHTKAPVRSSRPQKPHTGFPTAHKCVLPGPQNAHRSPTLGPLCSVADLCAFWGPGRTHLCAVGKPVCGFWGLEERTGAFVRAFLGTWKRALHRAFMQCGGRPVCILGAWKNADWG